MDVVTTPAEMRAWTQARRRAGQRIGFVPTMGALHRGHLSLVELAKSEADAVVVSIFVNPLQFDRRDDFDRYPRPVDSDLDACRAAGVHAVYAPTAAAMYPEGFDTRVLPGELATRWEGEHRPGHFSGMATVVLKLLTAVGPDVAVFGQKDAQQLAIVDRMVADFDLGIAVMAGETVREADGLALSSRNTRLTADHRRDAASISRGLSDAAAAFAAGERDADRLVSIARQPIDAAPLLRLEYLAVVDARTFDVCRTIDDRALLVVAAWAGDVRLIDNWPLSR